MNNRPDKSGLSTPLPGRSASSIYDIVLRLFIPFSIASVAMMVTLFIEPVMPKGLYDWLAPILVFAMVVSAIPLSILNLVGQAKLKSEAAAGYTTTSNRRQDLEQRDPWTLELVRHAGEPFLSRDAIIQMRNRHRARRSGNAHR